MIEILENWSSTDKFKMKSWNEINKKKKVQEFFKIKN